MKRTAADIIRQISIEVEGRKLPLEIMVRDIQMMRFKVRSLFGDISSLQTTHYDFVQSLWKIGRIDEIVSESLHTLDEDGQEALLDYFHQIEGRMQTNIRNSLTIQETSKRKKQILKLEIFKDQPLESTLN